MDIAIERWEIQIFHPLHETSYYLNLRCQYNPNIVMKPKHVTAVTTVFETLHPHDDCSTLGNEVRLLKCDCFIDIVLFKLIICNEPCFYIIQYCEAKGLFGKKITMANGEKMATGMLI